MGAGLVRDDVDGDTTFEHLGEDRCRVPDESDRARDALFFRVECTCDCDVDVVRHLVKVTVVNAALKAFGVDVDDDHRTVIKGHGEGLGAAHPTAASRQRQRSGEGSVELLARNSSERLVGSLKDSLCADVNPRAGRHLAVHRQPFGFEPAEFGPVSPITDEVRVRDEYARSPFVRREDSDGFSRLDEQSLVRLERVERVNDGVERFPVPRCASRAAVHDEIVGTLGHIGVKVVHQHALGGFGRPVLGRNGASACRSHSSGFVTGDRSSYGDDAHG